MIDKVRELFYSLINWASPYVGKVIQSYIDKLERDAYLRGKNDGLKERPRQWEIIDKQTIVNPTIEKSIYGPKCFRVTETMKAKMRAEVTAAVSNKIIPEPTPDQWKMILADHPATYVIAGAGSGKSTTLILRIIFMLHHLKVPRSSMTVVSFTKAACEELRENLIEVSNHWQLGIDENISIKLVKTFHSALYRIAKLQFGEVSFFENYPPKGFATESDEDDVENPASSAKLNDDQLRLLGEAYRAVYEKNKDFKNDVLAMLKIESMRSSDLPESPKGIGTEGLKAASIRDQDLVREINQRWKDNNLWPKNIPIKEGPIEAFTARGYQFFANAYNEATKQYIFLGGLGGEDQLYSEDENLNCKENPPLGKAINVKKNILSLWGSGTPQQYINSKTAAERFKYLATYLAAINSQEAGSAPIFPVKLEGELSGAEIVEAFYSQAGFIESMGQEVAGINDKIPAFRQDSLEYYFASALGIFWKEFQDTLHKHGIMTFNRAFLTLTSTPPLAGACTAMRHLLIDEFQDISPQIVNWIKAVQRQLISDAHPGVDVSLMAIGDDWQSIYGWRGSSPGFFIDFAKHFPVHSLLATPEKYKMDENFRSNKYVVNHAGHLLQGIREKTPKSPRSEVPSQPGGHGVDLFEVGNLNEKVIGEIGELILSQLDYANGLSKPHKNRVIVMARTNDMLEKIETNIKNKLPKNSGVVFYTYHKAKGLQGEVAVMVEDTNYDQVHVLRNGVYRATKLFKDNYTYDDAARDEARRLAYVGITRGRQRVFWRVKEAKGAALDLRQALELENVQ